MTAVSIATCRGDSGLEKLPRQWFSAWSSTEFQSNMMAKSAGQLPRHRVPKALTAGGGWGVALQHRWLRWAGLSGEFASICLVPGSREAGFQFATRNLNFQVYFPAGFPFVLMLDGRRVGLDDERVPKPLGWGLLWDYGIQKDELLWLLHMSCQLR